MGLKEIVGIRQYTGFTPAGKVVKMYRVTYTTDKSVGEFTFDIEKEKYTAKSAMEMAHVHATEIDAAIG